jgi:hypothetical protein
MTHSELIESGEKWLKRPYKNCLSTGHSACSLVLIELVTIAGEIPDCIGFNYHSSIVLEAKTSLSDFYADAKKHWRIYPDYGMGDQRFFICEENIIPVEKVNNGWGLLNVIGKKIIVVKDSAIFNANKKNEILMLLSYIRRNK